jgi:hypothetical protein
VKQWITTKGEAWDDEMHGGEKENADADVTHMDQKPEGECTFSSLEVEEVQNTLN